MMTTTKEVKSETPREEAPIKTKMNKDYARMGTNRMTMGKYRHKLRTIMEQPISI